MVGAVRLPRNATHAALVISLMLLMLGVWLGAEPWQWPARSSDPVQRSIATAQAAHERRLQGIGQLRKTLTDHRYATMDAETMTELLNLDLMLHATSVAETLPTLRQLWAEAPAQQSKNGEGIYLHKKVYHATYESPPVSAGLGNVTQTQMPVRQRGSMVYDEANLRREWYVAHQTTSTKDKATPHYTRMYPSLPDRWDDDPLLRAVHRLFAEVFTEAAQLEMGIRQPAGNIIFQFCYRTLLQAAEGRIKGDPGPEGVHVDGGTAAMILVIRRENIKPLTGGTRVWSTVQGTGKPTQADIDSNKVLHSWKPTHPLEALFFLDESVLHEALQGELLDQDAGALRDMYILDIRRKDLSWQVDSRI